MFLSSFVFFVISFFAGIGLIFLGLRFLSESFQVVFAPLLKKVLDSISKSPLSSFFAGFGTSFLVQSRSSASLMSMSYIGAGQMTLSQLMLFLLGSQLGTVPTIFLFLSPHQTITYFLLFLGFFPMFFIKDEEFSHWGKGIFALGLLLLGQTVLMDSFSHFSFQFQDVKVSLEAFDFWIVSLVSMGLGFLFRSSVALLVVLISALLTGVIDSSVAMTMILGINLGTALPFISSCRRSLTVVKRGACFFVFVHGLSFLFATLFFKDLSYFTNFLRQEIFFHLNAV
ncbi:MAG: Na/Pi cotransporter family protein, partial [Bdellovibrio sp.]